jgi:hypothetical protein
MLRKSLDTYKKKIDANHDILFSYKIAIDRLEFLFEENLLRFFDETGDVVRSIAFDLHLKIDDTFFVGFNQSFFRTFDSILYITKTSYCDKEIGFLKVFAQFDTEKTSFERIKNLAKEYNLNDYELYEDLFFITKIPVDYAIFSLEYV